MSLAFWILFHNIQVAAVVVAMVVASLVSTDLLS